MTSLYQTPAARSPAMRGIRVVYSFVGTAGASPFAGSLAGALRKGGEKVSPLAWSPDRRQLVSAEGDAPPVIQPGDWLLCPDVPAEGDPSGLDLIVEARRLGLKSVFLFHDLNPLRDPALAARAGACQTYLQHLLLANLVIPLSKGATRDLVLYYREHEAAAPASLPPIVPLPLPAALAGEAASTALPSPAWNDYAASLSATLDRTADPLARLGAFYYLIDLEQHPSGAGDGVRRIARQLASGLLRSGLRVVATVWDPAERRFLSAPPDLLARFAGENGPRPADWSPWQEPGPGRCNDWIFEPGPAGGPGRTELPRQARRLGLASAALFHDAIPLRLPALHAPEAVAAHAASMRSLASFDLILPVSDYSKGDLLHLLIGCRDRVHSFSQRFQTCVLPGEFPGIPRETALPARNGEPVRILAVSALEPRKNHLTLLDAFNRLRKTGQPVELVLAGGAPHPELAARVEALARVIPGLRWEKAPDDARLRELYAACDFTVYPSAEEGFGLPILESLWNGRPCLCHEQGAMRAASQGGGCLTVDITDPAKLAEAMERLASDGALRASLAGQALSRPLKTWDEYAREVALRLAEETSPPVPGILGGGNPATAEAFYAALPNLRRRPLLSICISTYNRAGWLEVALRNLTRLLPQAHADVELVVCDNASPDRTPEVAAPYLSRPDFRYYRNPVNVGMLGNLRVTAHHAQGKYVWILGDDDVILPGAIERIVNVVRQNPELGLVYLNYAYTREENAAAVTDDEAYLRSAIPIGSIGGDIKAPLRHISAISQNLFTAIYCLVFRRDHALRAYSRNTEGRPFSTLSTCIPTTLHVLDHMMDEPAYWMGYPQLVVNMNVSWMKYAPLWILENIPEALDLAERRGGPPQGLDHWRAQNIGAVKVYWAQIFGDDPHGNTAYFSPLRVVMRLKHLPDFAAAVPELAQIYESARAIRHPAADVPTRLLFSAFLSP